MELREETGPATSSSTASSQVTPSVAPGNPPASPGRRDTALGFAVVCAVICGIACFYLPRLIFAAEAEAVERAVALAEDGGLRAILSSGLPMASVMCAFFGVVLGAALGVRFVIRSGLALGIMLSAVAAVVVTIAVNQPSAVQTSSSAHSSPDSPSPHPEPGSTTTKRKADSFKPGPIEKGLTPEDVERNPEKHYGKTVRWMGEVAKIKEAGPRRHFLVPLRNRFTLTGRTELEFRVERRGGRRGWDFIGDEPLLLSGDSALSLAEYMYGGELPSVKRKQFVEFTATILGQTCRKHSLYGDRLSCSTLFVVHDVGRPGLAAARERNTVEMTARLAGVEQCEGITDAKLPEKNTKLRWTPLARGRAFEVLLDALSSTRVYAKAKRGRVRFEGANGAELVASVRGGRLVGGELTVPSRGGCVEAYSLFVSGDNDD